MPELSRFYGIIVRVQFGDHGPPHFHVQCGGAKAVLRLQDLMISHGRLPPQAQRMVLEWARQHREELRRAWARAERGENPGKIAPLE